MYIVQNIEQITACGAGATTFQPSVYRAKSLISIEEEKDDDRIALC